MGSNFPADVPGNIQKASLALAAVASNGGAARYPILVAPQKIRVKGFVYNPYAGDQDINSASYRLLTIVDAGPAGTGTVVVASLALTASIASMGTGAGVVATANQDMDSGDVVVFSQATVGGDHTTGTVIPASRVEVLYELR